MNNEPTQKFEIRATDRLANERTFLAWIRTAISIIAFGFVVIRFLLPQRPIDAIQRAAKSNNADNHALFTGISFFLIGAAISTLAYRRYRLNDKQILTGIIKNPFPLPTILLVSILIICILLTIYFLDTAFNIQ